MEKERLFARWQEIRGMLEYRKGREISELLPILAERLTLLASFQSLGMEMLEGESLRVVELADDTRASILQIALILNPNFMTRTTIIELPDDRARI